MIGSQVYFLECGDQIKIGIATNVARRLKEIQMQAGSPVKLLGSVKGDLRIERALHKKLRPYRVIGEWYRDCAEVRAAVQNSLNNFDLSSDEQNPSILAQIARLLWPKNTAAHWAADARCSTRAAERWLAGERDLSSDAVAVIVSEILKRHQMRNVRVTARR